LNPSFEKFDNDKVSFYINEGILNPLWDLLNRGGSSWRQVSSILLAESFGRDMKEIKNKKNEDVWWLLGSIELIRLGTLICDDIED
jgi:geranylgeranyl pyrophosphate synthase